jgi:hypothetical protein
MRLIRPDNPACFLANHLEDLGEIFFLQDFFAVALIAANTEAGVASGIVARGAATGGLPVISGGFMLSVL